MALLVARTIFLLLLSVFIVTGNVFCAKTDHVENIDSILIVLKTADSAEQTILYEKLARSNIADVALLNQIADYYSSNNNFELAVDYHFKAMHESIQNDDSIGISRSTSGVALNYDLGEKYDSALFYYYKALKLAETTNDKNLTANTLNRLGTIFLNWGNYSDALDYFLKSLQNFELLSDSGGLAKVYNNLGIIYFDYDEYDKALTYYEKSYLYDSLMNNLLGQAQLLNNIAITYENYEQTSAALTAYKRSLVLASQVKDYYQIAVTNSNLGELYLILGEYNNAEKCFKSSKENYLLANSQIGIAESDILLGNLNYERGYYHTALGFYFKGLAFVKPLNITNALLNAYAGIDASYHALGEYEKAYEYSNEYWYLSDSIFSLKTSNQLALLQQGYQIQKKNQEMELQAITLQEQEERIHRQRIVVALLFVVIIISLVFAFILFRQQKFRKRAFRQLLIQNKEILKNKEALIKAKEKAEESDQLKTSFLMNLSHELRTPMNGILGFTDLLKRDKVTKEEQKTYLSYISSSGKQLLKVLNDMLDMASIETGQIELSKENCNIHELFSSLFIVYQQEAKEMGKNAIQIIYNTPDNPGQYNIKADPRRLKQVVDNLILNALKFTEEGSVAFGFEVSEDHLLRIKVSDTGIGIARDQFDVIFDRFRQIDDSTRRQHGGSGLGLSLCKKIIELMDGRIYLQSEVGTGTTFYVELPYIKSQL